MKIMIGGKIKGVMEFSFIFLDNIVLLFVDTDGNLKFVNLMEMVVNMVLYWIMEFELILVKFVKC